MNKYLSELSSLTTKLLTTELLLQIGALIAAISIAFIFRIVLSRRIKRFHEQAKKLVITKDYPALLNIFLLINSVIFPFLVLLLANATNLVMSDQGYSVSMLVWVMPFISLWLVYCFILAFIDIMTPERFRKWFATIIRPFILFVALLMAFGLLDNLLAVSIRPSDKISITLRSLGAGIIVIYVFWFFGKQLQIFLRQALFPRIGLEPALNQVVSNIISYVLILSGFLFGISVIGIDLTLLTILLGGLSVGIGFGLQALVNNWISGIILLFEQTIKPNDVIEINGKITKVVKIGLRTMTVRTNANVEMIVPNGYLLDNIITNYTLSEREAEVPVDVGVPYSVDLHNVYKLLMQAAEEHEEVIYGLLRLQNFTDGVFLIRLMIYIPEPIKIFKIQHEVRTRIWELFKEHNVPLAYPERNLHLQMDQSIPVYNPTQGKKDTK